jgi:hypothetical protein
MGLSEVKLAAIPPTNSDPHARWFKDLENSVNHWIVITHVELFTRNKMANALLEKWGVRFFTDGAGRLSKRDVEKLNRVDSGLRTKDDGEVPVSKVIERLSFGFWSQLVTKRYESSLWAPVLRNCFTSKAPTKRAEIETAYRESVEIRNRIAHHETLSKPRFDGSFRRQLLLLNWLSESGYEEISARQQELFYIK